MGCGLLVFIFVRTANHDPDWLQRFRSAVVGLPEIIGVHRTSGELDYVAAGAGLPTSKPMIGSTSG